MEEEIKQVESGSTADNLSTSSSSEENNRKEAKEPTLAVDSLAVDLADGKNEAIPEDKVAPPTSPTAPQTSPRRGLREMSGRGHMRTNTQGSFRFKVSDPDPVGLVTEQIAEVRNTEEAKPMDYMSRQRLKLKNMIGGADQDGADAGEGDAEAVETDAPVQYQIKSRTRPKVKKMSDVLRLCGAAAGFSYDPTADSINGPINAYVDWTFRASFLTVFISMLVFFMLWVTGFAILLLFAGRVESECIYVSGAEFFNFRKQGSFSDVFQLSWTTFSTVGYGSVFPSTSVQTTAQTNCSFVQFLCTVEAFVGVLFAGFCGAILFGKITRVQANAKVVFSGPICIRFGAGADVEDDDDVRVLGEETPQFIEANDSFTGTSSTHSDLSSNKRHVEISCPVLEFRIVNQNAQFNRAGAIVDASLSCVSAILQDVDVRAHRKSIHGQDVDVRAHRKSIIGSHGSGSKSTRGFGRHTPKKARSSARRAFSKLEIETSEHPFFERVWVARHILNESSPLLKPHVARRIKKNHGYWPADLNSAEAVRESLCFSQIIVSFSGVSNFTMSSVYAQKVYDILDVNVGYQFAPVLYRKEGTDTLGIDIDMLNDIMEQEGGGAEPLMLVE